MSASAVAEDVVAWIDGFNQEGLAAAALVLGGALLVRGFAIMKLVLLTGLGCTTGGFAYALGSKVSQPVALLAAVGVAAGTFQACHVAYPLFVFLMGSAMGGCSAFALRTLFLKDLDPEMATPAASVGFTMLSSVFMGLLFRHYRNVGWRVFTPIAGSLLAVMSLRFFVAEALSKTPVKVSDFVEDFSDLQDPSANPFAMAVAVSWGVFACIGWYLQLATFFGDDDPLPLSDALLHRLDTLLIRFPQLADSAHSDIMKNLTVSSVGSREPLLGSTASSGNLRSTTVDLRPEAAVVLAIVSVLVLNFFLASQPLMFLGHVMFMSSAFLPLITAGLVSYSSPTGFLPGIFGPQSGGPFMRHFSHATFNSLAFVFAISGYVCIYVSHARLGQSQIGLGADKTWNRTIHVWNGYAVLALMLVQCGSGVMKLVKRISKEETAKFHGTLGRWIYGLAAVNQVLGYWFKGFMPAWASVLLTMMLLAAISATYFFLNARVKSRADRADAVVPLVLPDARATDEDAIVTPRPHRPELPHFSLASGVLGAKCHNPVTMRLDSLRSINVSSGSSSTVASGTSPGKERLSRSPSRRTAFMQWESVLDYVDKAQNQHLLKECFADWHRSVQSQGLVKVKSALEGQENMLDFLSAAVVGNYDENAEDKLCGS